MNAPDTVYLHICGDSRAKARVPTLNRVDDNSIPYDRRKTCVWRPHRNTGSMRPDDHAAITPANRVINWIYCPYCGGRIEITVGDVKEEG